MLHSAFYLRVKYFINTHHHPHHSKQKCNTTARHNYLKLGPPCATLTAAMTIVDNDPCPI